MGCVGSSREEKKGEVSYGIGGTSYSRFQGYSADYYYIPVKRLCYGGGK